MKWLAAFLLAGLHLYRRLLSPVLTFLFLPFGFGCRYSPTCSVFARDAIQLHGPLRGTGLALRRLCRCHPWGGSGFDPVPPRLVSPADTPKVERPAAAPLIVPHH